MLWPLFRTLRFRLAMASRVAVPWTQVGGYLGRVSDLGRFAAPRPPGTSQGGGWTFFCPSHHYVRGILDLKYLERGGPCGRLRCVFLLNETQNATEVLCRRAAQVIPGGPSAPEEGVRRLKSSEVRVCQQCQ